jgi:hypothetical protein
MRTVLALGCLLLGCRGNNSPPVVTVVAHDFSFEAPDSLPAGLTTLKLVNAGRWNHQALLFRIPEGHSAAEVRKALQADSEPGWPILAAGGPGPTAPGDTTNVTLILQPGSYTLICFYVGGGAPHFLAGMVKDLRVIGTVSQEVVDPESAVTIEMRDYAFGLSRPLTRGPSRLRVANLGPQDHELLIFRLTQRYDSAALSAWIGERQPNAPAMEAVGGFSGLPAGGHGTTDIVFEPGTYLLFCDGPDAKDGRPHRAHGMWQIVKIQ